MYQTYLYRLDYYTDYANSFLLTEKVFKSSIDDLFEELLEQYNTYKSGFDNKMFWWAEYHVDYNEENHYPEKIDLSIRYERPVSKYDGDDVYFHVIISDFTILE